MAPLSLSLSLPRPHSHPLSPVSFFPLRAERRTINRSSIPLRCDCIRTSLARERESSSRKTFDEKSKKWRGRERGEFDIESRIFLFLPSNAVNAVPRPNSKEGRGREWKNSSPSLNFHAIRRGFGRGEGEGIIDGRTAESKDRVLSRNRAH